MLRISKIARKKTTVLPIFNSVGKREEPVITKARITLTQIAVFATKEEES